MAFEIEEVEVDSYDPIKLAQTLYPHLPIEQGLDALFAEMKKRNEHEEFWADPCWSEPDRTTN